MNSPQNSAPDTATAEPSEWRCRRHPESATFFDEDEHGYKCASCETEHAHAAAVAAIRARDEQRRKNEAREEHQRKAQADLEQRLGAAGIPPRYRERGFDTFPSPCDEARQHVSTLRSYANRFPAMRAKGISALLVGGTGTGKTGLACSVANAVVRAHGSTAVFMSAYAAVRHQRDTWGRRGRTEREALDDLLQPDLLILDEVGTSVGGDSELSMLFEVLNGRYERMAPTMLLSNLPLEDYEAAGVRRPGLRSYLGPRILDRFHDDGSFTLAFDWPSLRGRPA